MKFRIKANITEKERIARALKNELNACNSVSVNTNEEEIKYWYIEGNDVLISEKYLKMFYDEIIE